jgi:hypothetical protein
MDTYISGYNYAKKVIRMHKLITTNNFRKYNNSKQAIIGFDIIEIGENSIEDIRIEVYLPIHSV